MKIEELELLASSLRVLGLNIEIPTLELIFVLNNELKEKKMNISLGEIQQLGMEIKHKYNLDREL